MKKIVTYKCDICGRVYDSEKSCQVCENSHVKILDEVYVGSLAFEGDAPIPAQLTIGFIKDKCTGEWCYARYRIICGSVLTEVTPEYSTRFLRGSKFKRQRNRKEVDKNVDEG